MIKFLLACLCIWTFTYIGFVFLAWIDIRFFIDEPEGEDKTFKKVWKDMFWDNQALRYSFWAGWFDILMAPLVFIMVLLITVGMMIAFPFRKLIKYIEERLNETGE